MRGKIVTKPKLYVPTEPKRVFTDVVKHFLPKESGNLWCLGKVSSICIRLTEWETTWCIRPSESHTLWGVILVKKHSFWGGPNAGHFCDQRRNFVSLPHEPSSNLRSKQLLSSLNIQHQPNIRALRSSIIPSKCAYIAFRDGFSTSALCHL